MRRSLNTKKIVLFVLSLFFGMTMYAQSNVDKEIKGYVEAIVALRRVNGAKTKTAEAFFKKNKGWRLMDELKDGGKGEHKPALIENWFGLQLMLNRIITERTGKSDVPGIYLMDKYSEYRYALIEKGIKAKNKVSYTFDKHEGKQDFVIIPSITAPTLLTVMLYKDNKQMKVTSQSRKDGCVFVHCDSQIGTKNKITLEIENKSNDNVAIVVLNFNSGK